MRDKPIKGRILFRKSYTQLGTKKAVDLQKRKHI